MFQTFDDDADPSRGAGRVAALREWLAANELDGFIVPRSDEHQGEYVAPRSERLQWLTGFSGSAGAVVVLRSRAVLFVDGRYTLQARHQVDPAIFAIDSLISNPPPEWLKTNASSGMRIGVDPWLHTISEVKALRNAAAQASAEIVTVDANPIDTIWADQPDAPVSPVTIQPAALAGELAKDKLARIAEAIAAGGATHAVLTDPSSVAWIFNIRGNDVPHTPLALGFAILAADGSHSIYLDKRKLDIEAEAYLTQLASIRRPDTLEADLAGLAQGGAGVMLDPVLAAERLRMLVAANGGTAIEASDPARIPRATKNAAELAGSRAAHRRDGAAMVRMLAWLDRQEPGSTDEIAAVQRLEALRREAGEQAQMPLRDVSFSTIAGAGPNGAIIHYRVSRGTSRVLGSGELFLLDSGGQYQDGTTDITRTVPIGTPTPEMRERYTLVLKGMIRISLLRFPPGTRGSDIDAFARAALWAHGLDYAHGTGHGVGAYLSVHEGPQRIARTGTQPLLAGMILSNEPGYYKEGQYGIRLENLVVVSPELAVENGDIAMHAFETLTLAPFDKRLIQHELLSRDELHWLDTYHARVLAEIGPMLDGEALAWLENAAAPLPVIPHGVG
ncbi:MAG: aminopeptidase P family protein [Rhizobiaceae bacterium]|nr:aminopeptidase P family protein [Rhizobiaceae bacterium]